MQGGGAATEAAAAQEAEAEEERRVWWYDYINPANRLVQWGSMASGVVVMVVAVGLFVPYMVNHSRRGLELSKTALVIIPVGLALCLFSWLCIFASTKLSRGAQVAPMPLPAHEQH